MGSLTPGLGARGALLKAGTNSCAAPPQPVQPGFPWEQSWRRRLAGRLLRRELGRRARRREEEGRAVADLGARG